MKQRDLVIALVAANLVLVAAFVARSEPAAAGTLEVVRARAIELVDERGQVRAQLDVEASGEAVLRLRDSKGEIRVKLGAGADGSGLLLANGATEPGIHMLARRGGTSLTLAEGGQRRVLTP